MRARQIVGRMGRGANPLASKVSFGFVSLAFQGDFSGFKTRLRVSSAESMTGVSGFRDCLDFKVWSDGLALGRAQE